MSGRNDYIDGELTFTPPISWKEISDNGERFVKTHNDKERDRLLWLVVEEGVPVEINGGTLIPKHGASFRISEADELSAEGLLMEVQDILKTFCVGPEGQRTFEGTIQVWGEHPGNIWRVRIYNGCTAKEEHVTCTWPDGTKAV